MTGLSVSEVQGDRTGYAREYAEKWGHVIVLKGAFTVIADPDGRVATIPIATPALATAGTGDVLSGIILSLRGQGLPAFEAAVTGAFLHARAGEVAALEMGSEIGVVAGDIAEMLPEVFRGLNRQ
jgi:NAD(P)H-hydrate epimerase